MVGRSQAGRKQSKPGTAFTRKSESNGGVLKDTGISLKKFLGAGVVA